MHCSTCGTVLTQGLSYCNRCGAKTALTTNPLATTKGADRLVDVVLMLGVVSGGVVIAGLIFVFLLVEKLLDKLLNPSAVLAFMVISLAVVFGISGLLIRQLSRTLNIYLQRGEEEKPKQLPEPTPLQLDTPREPVASVTDHTTRAFEPSRQERKGGRRS